MRAVVSWRVATEMKVTVRRQRWRPICALPLPPPRADRDSPLSSGLLERSEVAPPYKAKRSMLKPHAAGLQPPLSVLLPPLEHIKMAGGS